MKKRISVVLIVVSLMSLFGIVVNAYTLAELEERKVNAHNMANQARALGFTEEDNIVVTAKQIWSEADNMIKNNQYDDYIEIVEEVKVEGPQLVRYYTDEEVVKIAKIMYNESRGIKSKTEIACIGWTVLNRVGVAGMGAPGMGNQTITSIISYPNQFAYSYNTPTVSDYGYDLIELARDVCEIWNKEKNGLGSEGRVLPKEYMWYGGDGVHNYFRTTANPTGRNWNYSWGKPYDN